MNTEQRFWTKVAVTGDCWIWKGAKSRDGYGLFNLDGKCVLAHRVAAMLSHMDIDGVCVCHICDVRSCCNPAHLFTGTIGDNNHDRHRKGRSRGGSMAGSENPASKLNQAAVDDIRSKREPRSCYARRYGVTYWTIRDIQTERIWRTQSSNERAARI